MSAPTAPTAPKSFTFDLICDLVSHLENIGYENTSDMNPAIEFLKSRGLPMTEVNLAVAREIIDNNF